MEDKAEDEYEAEDAESFEEQEFKDEYEDKQHESTAPSVGFKSDEDDVAPARPKKKPKKKQKR